MKPSQASHSPFAALMRAQEFNTIRTYHRGLSREPRLVIQASLAQTFYGLAQASAVLVIVPLFGRAFGRSAGFSGRLGDLLNSIEARFGLMPIVLAFVGLGVVAAVFRKVSADACCRLRLAVEGKLREEMMEAVNRISWPGFTELRLGTLSKALVADCARYADGCERMVRGLGSALFALILLIVAVIVAPQVVAVVCPALLAGLVAFRFAHRRIGKEARMKAQTARRAADGSFEMISHWKFVKSTGMARRFLNQAKSAHDRYTQQSLSVTSASHTVHALFESWSFVLIGACIAYGVLQSTTHAAEKLAVFGLFVRMLPQVLSAQRHYDGGKSHQHAALAWQKLYDEIRSHTEPVADGRAFRFERDLVLRDVTVCLSRGAVLKNLTFEVPKFGCVAITGASGAGKTTVLDVISGLLQPTSGDVLVDGQPLNRLDLLQWQGMIGLVSQNVPLFYGSVSENIALGDETPDIDRIWQAAELASAMDFIRMMPEGFDTNIGEGGIKLSGGQRQRIAIARALYKSPELLILDEVTSSLDATNEAAVTQAIRQLKGKVTMIIVTHRLHTIDWADRVLSLEDGALHRAARPSRETIL